MTKSKPSQFKAKLGRKPRRLKNHQDKFLKILYSAGDISPWQASLYVKCGYAYAKQKYRDFSLNLSGGKFNPDFYS